VDLQSNNNFNLELNQKYAPLNIDIKAYPVMIHDSKFVFNGPNDKVGHAIEIDRPSESAEFTITVRNKDTGNTLLSERCSNFAASAESREWVIYSDGPYIIDISGYMATVDLYTH
jgi:hypothetical protein